MSFKFLKNEKYAPMFVALAAATMLLVFYFIIRPERVHVSGYNFMLNDQVEYITTARNLLEHGRLESSLIYISTLKSGAYRHLPGHATVLAASYGVFGYGVWSSFFPSLLGFILTAVFVFLMGRRLFSTPTGWSAAVLFIAFAPYQIFSFTAMAEMTFVCAAVGALFAYTIVSARYGFWVAPLFLAIPFFFRETGSLLVLIMLSLLSETTIRDYRNKMLLIVGLSVAGLIPIYLLIRGGGGSSFFLANLLGLTFDDKYRSISYSFPPLDFSTIMELLGRHIVDVSQGLGSAWKSSWSSFEAASITAVEILFLLSCVGFLAKGLVRRFAIATVFLCLALAVMILALYQVADWVGVRMLLFLFPWLAISISAIAFDSQLSRGWRHLLLATAFIATLYPLTFSGKFSTALKEKDAFDDRNREFIETLKHDDQKVLISSVFISMNYVLNHYPVRWGFHPANDATWKFTREKLSVGTLVLRKVEFGEALHRETILESTPRSIVETQWLGADLEVFSF